MRKTLMLTLLVAITPLLFAGCAAKKNPYAECDKLEPTLEEVKKGGNFMPYVTAKELKQEECRKRTEEGMRR